MDGLNKAVELAGLRWQIDAGADCGDSGSNS